MQTPNSWADYVHTGVPHPHHFCIAPHVHSMSFPIQDSFPIKQEEWRKTPQPLKHLIPTFILQGRSEKTKPSPCCPPSPRAPCPLWLSRCPPKPLEAAPTFHRIGEAPARASSLQRTETHANHVGASHGAHSAMNSQGQNHSGVIKNINVAYQAAGEKIIRQPDEREMEGLVIVFVFPESSSTGLEPHTEHCFLI